MMTRVLGLVFFAGASVALSSCATQRSVKPSAAPRSQSPAQTGSLQEWFQNFFGSRSSKRISQPPLATEPEIVAADGAIVAAAEPAAREEAAPNPSPTAQTEPAQTPRPPFEETPPENAEAERRAAARREAQRAAALQKAAREEAALREAERRALEAEEARLRAAAEKAAAEKRAAERLAARRAREFLRGFSFAQTPTWTREDMEFFLHGSMGVEFLPERLLTAFRATYPSLFPGADLSAFGLLHDRGYDLPVGLSRREVPQLGGQVALGLNCAACHTAEFAPAGRNLRGEPTRGAPVRVIGTTGNFDSEAFIGAVFAAIANTADLFNMEKFLPHYLRACDPRADASDLRALAAIFAQQRDAIAAALLEEWEKGKLYAIPPEELRLDRARIVHGDIVPTVRALLKLFHNMRELMHIPHQLPETAPPRSGPGRNDPWGIISAGLFGVQTEYAPIKIGAVWNMDQKTWAHMDGNNRDTLSRNFVAAFALGAPMQDGRGVLDVAALQRHTDLMQVVRPPRYPWAVDPKAAARGAKIYEISCARCHDGPEDDSRLYAPAEIGTDPTRARIFDAQQAARHNHFPHTLAVEGYTPPAEPAFRSTQRYWAPSLEGVWARVPYLHNGSVRTMEQLLTPPEFRERKWFRGTRAYLTQEMGLADDGDYVFDATSKANSNGGHAYGVYLTVRERRDLIEYLKTK